MAVGQDNSTSGYFEAAIWRWASSFGPQYVSPTFGGTWQSSGVAGTLPAGGSFPVYLASDPPHTVVSAAGYVIGFGLLGTSVAAYGFRVNYTIP